MVFGLKMGFGVGVRLCCNLGDVGRLLIGLMDSFGDRAYFCCTGWTHFMGFYLFHLFNAKD